MLEMEMDWGAVLELELMLALVWVFEWVLGLVLVQVLESAWVLV